MLMSVFYCDGFMGLTTIFIPKADVHWKWMKMTGFSCLRDICNVLEIYSKKGHSLPHSDMQELIPRLTLIFKGPTLQSATDIY